MAMLPRRRAKSANSSVCTSPEIVPSSFTRAPLGYHVTIDNTGRIDVVDTCDAILRKKQDLDREEKEDLDRDSKDYKEKKEKRRKTVEYDEIPIRTKFRSEPVSFHSDDSSSNRLTKHKLRNNTFTFSKYLARKDASEDQLSYNGTMLSDCEPIPQDEPAAASSSVTSSTAQPAHSSSLSVPSSFVPSSSEDDVGDKRKRVTVITPSASEEEGPSRAYRDEGTPTPPDVGTIPRPGSGVQKILEKYGKTKNDDDDARPRRKSESRNRRKSQPGEKSSQSGSGAEIFMNLSNKISQRMSFSRRGKKAIMPAPELSAQQALENYLYGKQNYSKLGKSKRELDYRDMTSCEPELYRKYGR